MSKRKLMIAWVAAVAVPLAWAQPPSDGGPPPGGRPNGPAPLNLDTADADGNGVVSATEFKSVWADSLTKQFNRLDTDGDGVLSEAELAKIPQPRRRPEGDAPPPPDGARGNRGGTAASDAHRPPTPPDPATFDADEDGVVTWDEFLAAHQAVATALFDLMDTDDDGSLSQAELAARPGPPRGGPRGGGPGGQGRSAE